MHVTSSIMSHPLRRRHREDGTRALRDMASLSDSGAAPVLLTTNTFNGYRARRRAGRDLSGLALRCQEGRRVCRERKRQRESPGVERGCFCEPRHQAVSRSRNRRLHRTPVGVAPTFRERTERIRARQVQGQTYRKIAVVWVATAGARLVRDGARAGVRTSYLRPFLPASSEATQYAFDPMYPRVSGMAARMWRRTSRMSTLPSF